jgi:tetratricopeptide (TPR) repeat protein
MLLLVLLGARTAGAEDAAAARAHFEAGTRAYNLGEFRQAAEEYRQAYRLKADPRLLYDIALSYRLGKDGEQALFFYRSYLRNLPEARNRKEVVQRIAALEEQIKQQQAPPNDVVKPLPPVVTAAPAQEAPPSPVQLHVLAQPTPATRTELVAAPSRRPVYKRWWLWTSLGVVAAGVGVGLGLGLGGGGPPTSHLGVTKVFQ